MCCIQEHVQHSCGPTRTAPETSRHYHRGCVDETRSAVTARDVIREVVGGGGADLGHPRGGPGAVNVVPGEPAGLVGQVTRAARSGHRARHPLPAIRLAQRRTLRWSPAQGRRLTVSAQRNPKA